MYRISMTKTEARQYAEWEFGDEAQSLFLDRCEPSPFDEFVLAPLSDTFQREPSGRYTRRAAEDWARRIRAAVHYQQGKAGESLSLAGVEVVSIKPEARPTD